MCLEVYWFKVLSCNFTTLPVRNQNKILKMLFVIFFLLRGRFQIMVSDVHLFQYEGCLNEMQLHA
jgi:hypothetical protein